MSGRERFEIFRRVVSRLHLARKLDQETAIAVMRAFSRVEIAWTDDDLELDGGDDLQAVILHAIGILFAVPETVLSSRMSRSLEREWVRFRRVKDLQFRNVVQQLDWEIA